MESLPLEVRLAICRDAQLMRVWQRQLAQIQWWIGPVFAAWTRIAHYEREWPGSTESARPGHPSIVWEP